MSGFIVTEIEDRFLWSVHANSGQDLLEFTKAVFAETARFGDMLTRDSMRLIQLWPRKSYLLAEQSLLPDMLQEYSSMITDISHGICELSLVSDQALEFLDVHTSANLRDQRISQTRNLRCLLGQYPVILWWNQDSDIRLLVDRSYAQSLRDYLNHLMQRWSEESI